MKNTASYFIDSAKRLDILLNTPLSAMLGKDKNTVYSEISDLASEIENERELRELIADKVRYLPVEDQLEIEQDIMDEYYSDMAFAEICLQEQEDYYQATRL